MTAVTGSEALSDPTIVGSVVIALTTWASDPAVMTAIASLLTAGAAYWRSRHRRSHDHAPQISSHAPSLAEAYSTLHEAEEKIREELLQQLQHLQEEAERIGQDLAHYRQATVKLEEGHPSLPQWQLPRTRPTRNPLIATGGRLTWLLGPVPTYVTWLRLDCRYGAAFPPFMRWRR